MHELIHSVFVVVPFLLVFFFLARGTGDVPDESSWHGIIQYGVILHNPSILWYCNPTQHKTAPYVSYGLHARSHRGP